MSGSQRKLPPLEQRLRPSQAQTWRRKAEVALADYEAEHPEVVDPLTCPDPIYTQYERLIDLAHRARAFAEQSMFRPCASA